MKPTEILISEHKLIRLMLKVVDKIAENIKAVKGFYIHDMEKITGFMQHYVGSKHNSKEENYLFPAIEEACKSKDDKMLNFLIHEHSSSQDFVKDISKTIESYKIVGAHSCASLADTLIKYSKTNETCMKVEENILFPFADMALTVEKQEQILKKFEKHDNDIKKENFAVLLDEYNEKYLKTNNVLVAEFNY
jgi:hemerythrin-like domain-containing protein